MNLRYSIPLLILPLLIPNVYGEASIVSLVELIRVVDGDTIIVKGMEGFRAGEEFRVRLADINAPEMDTPEGRIAKDRLTDMLRGKYLVLDIDTKYIYDRYGRVVAVVYTVDGSDGMYTLTNMNMLLVEEGYATYRDYDNSFNPSSWSLRIECNDDSQIRCITEVHIPILVLTILASASILIRRLIR